MCLSFGSSSTTYLCAKDGSTKKALRHLFQRMKAATQSLPSRKRKKNPRRK